MKIYADNSHLCKEDYMTQQTRLWLSELRLPAMEKAYSQQLELPASAALGFDERLALLVQAEVESRRDKKLSRLLKTANLKDKSASLEELDFSKSRGLDKSFITNLADCRWIRKGHNLLVSGACGTGKTYLVSAFGNAACRQGYSVRSFRLPRLLVDMQIGRGDGSWENTSLAERAALASNGESIFTTVGASRFCRLGL